MPGPSGLDLQEALNRSPLALPVIFLTGHADVPSSVRAMKSGAVDFLTKPVERKALLAAVQNAVERDAQARSARNALATLRARFNSLSARERQVFEAVVAGQLNKQIAADLGAAERTVKAHRASMMDKMVASSVADLVHLAPACAPSRRSVRPSVCPKGQSCLHQGLIVDPAPSSHHRLRCQHHITPYVRRHADQAASRSVSSL